MPNTPKDRIEVFVTKGGKFRARVTPLDKSKPRFEITVLGKNWMNPGCRGLTMQQRQRIIEKCNRLQGRLDTQIESMATIERFFVHLQDNPSRHIVEHAIEVGALPRE